jgi:aspartate/methionine/tyrosine aminotransferase
MSKAFSLAGIRLGWIASRSSEIIEACADARHYTLISVGQLDDSVATYALSSSCVGNLLQRNTELARQNLKDLEEFVRYYEGSATWVRPRAGTTAFIKFVKNGVPVDDVAFCQQLYEKNGVMLAPGSQCFGDGEYFKGYVRVGYVPERQVLVDGLKALREFMENGFESVPLA